MLTASKGQVFSRPQKVTDLSQSFFNCIVYGAPGVGKTVFAATGPSPTLFLDCDQGLLSLQNPDPKLVQEYGIKTDEIYVEPIRSLEDVIRQINRIREENTASPGWWKTCVVDNITELQRVLMQDILRREGRATPQRQDWGTILMQMQTIVRSIRNLPLNTVFIAHEHRSETMIEPALSTSIRTELAGYVDLLARYVFLEKEVDGPKGKEIKYVRKLRCRPQIGVVEVVAKSRGWRFGDWEDPHLGKLIEKSRNSAPS